MALNPHLSTSGRNALLDALNAIIGAGGFLRIYDGSQPANADVALSGQTKLAELALSATVFAAAVSGAIAANAISDDTNADATGTASWATFVKSDGTRVLDVSVGTSGADINLNSTAITAGALVQVTSYSLSLPA